MTLRELDSRLAVAQARAEDAKKRYDDTIQAVKSEFGVTTVEELDEVIAEARAKQADFEARRDAAAAKADEILRGVETKLGIR